MTVFVNRSFMGFSESFQNVIVTCPLGKALAGFELSAARPLQALRAIRRTAIGNSSRRIAFRDISASLPIDAIGCTDHCLDRGLARPTTPASPCLGEGYSLNLQRAGIDCQVARSGRGRQCATELGRKSLSVKRTPPSGAGFK